jgi:hypothetical protein
MLYYLERKAVPQDTFASLAAPRKIEAFLENDAALECCQSIAVLWSFYYNKAFPHPTQIRALAKSAVVKW